MISSNIIKTQLYHPPAPPARFTSGASFYGFPLSRKAGLLFILFFNFLLSGKTAEASPFSPSYEINAGYHFAKTKPVQIEGSIKITVSNPSPEPLAAIPLMLYPNRFLAPPLSLPPEVFKKSFPKPVSPGGMEISKIYDSLGRSLEIHYLETGLGPKMVCEIILKDSLPPGQFTTFSLDFTTLIPERLGAFGQIKSVISADGGWHPYLPDFFNNAWQFNKPPPKADFTVNVSYPLPFELNHTGTLITKTIFNDHKVSRLQSQKTGFFSLIFSTQYRDMIVEGPGHAIYYSYFSKDKKYARQVLHLAEEALRFFETEYGPSNPSVLRLAEAYLYNDLYSEGDGIVLVSHTLYKIFFPLKKYHDARLLHGIYAQLWRAQIPLEEDWIIEMLSDYSTLAFLNKKLKHPLEGLEAFLTPFAFLPIVDEILYSPNPAFRQVFFKESRPFPFREQIRLYNTPRAEGTGILFKLQNLLGREKTLEIVSAYLAAVRGGERRSFVELSETLSGQDLTWFYQQWLNSFPEPDFGIENIQGDFTEETHTTTVTVAKKGEGAEPLTVRAIFKNQSVMEINRLFKETSGQFVFKNSSLVKTVEIDPDHQTNDPYLFNNRNPPKWKFLLDKFTGTIDLQTHTPELEVGGSFRRLYDDHNILGLYYYRFAETRGFRGDFNHTFPGRLDHQLIQTLGGNYKGEIVSLSGQEDETRGSLGLIYRITYLKYSLGFEYNLQFTGPEHPYNGQVYLDYANGIQWSPYHTLKFKAQLAESNGPLSLPFTAGGGSGLRGYTKALLTGSEKSVFSLDYAFPLYYDLDQNLFGFSLFHTLQGELFMDAGNASNEKNPFLFHQYLSDFGGGLNLEFDLFGAYPTNMALQLAYPIEPFVPEERSIHYYFNFGVHF